MVMKGRVPYRIRVKLSDPVNRERRSRSEAYTTKKEAEKRRCKSVTEIETGVAVDSAKMTVADLGHERLDVLSLRRAHRMTFGVARNVRHRPA